MRVIAGRLARRTPFFAAELTGVTFNPSWTVPEKIALEDKLPLVLGDRASLARQHLRVFRVERGRWLEVDPAAVDWAAHGPGRFPYRLRQDPGPENALGRIKFQLPNRWDVYLHDTPSKELFARAERSFSSGCIRVERALDLAERLLAADPAWPRARIEEAIAAGQTLTVPLREPLPVYLLYATAWVDPDGTLQLREDVYGRDGELAAALGWPAP
jgi:murein L,D-transpeptidase YcbB/YkuD